MTGPADEDAAWQAWASREPARRRRPRALVVALAVLLVLTVAGGIVFRDFGRRTLGDEEELRVVFIGGNPNDRSRDEGVVGLTPLRVRAGQPADLAGWGFTTGGAPAPGDVPHYVDVRVTNRGVVQLDARLGLLSAYDEQDRPLTRVVPIRPGVAAFTACPEPTREDNIPSGQSITVCFIVAVPPGRRLDRLSTGGTVGLGEPTSWAVD